jgi:hypothetical protein
VAQEDSSVITNMRARAEQCRRLAGALTDRTASAVLLKMAEEVEADILRLKSVPGGGDVSAPRRHCLSRCLRCDENIEQGAIVDERLPHFLRAGLAALVPQGRCRAPFE